MSYGLKTKIREMVAGMKSIRSSKKIARDISLEQFINEKYKDPNGKPLSARHLFSECGINAKTTTVDELMADEDTQLLLPEVVHEGVRRGMGLAQRERMRAASMATVVADGGNERFMTREVFLDPIFRGAIQATFYPDLTVGEENVPQPTVTIPRIEISDAALKDSAEAATIEEGTVSYGSKDVKLTKKARGFKITYEAIRYNSLSLAALFFEDAGRILGHTLNGMAVTTLINGDQADGSEAAAVIGVNDTNDKVAWYDLTRVGIRLALLGRIGSQIIAGEDMALHFENLEEVKNRFQGAPLLSLRRRSPLTIPDELFISVKVPANKIVINDPSASLVQLTSAPLLVESDKIISKQIEESYVSITTGFAKLQRNASVVVDGAAAWVANSGTDFPSWMAPYSD